MTKGHARPPRHLFACLSFALALAPGLASAQATYTWISPTSSSWSTPANWSPARVAPAADDVLVFDGGSGSPNTVIGIVSETLGQIRLQNGANVNMTAVAPGPVTLTLTGGVGDDFRVPAGCQLLTTTSGATVFTIELASGATGLVAGKISTVVVNMRFLAQDANALVFAAGSQMTYGGPNPVFGSANPGSVHFQSGALYVATGTGDVFGAPNPASVAVFEPGSTWRTTGSTLPPMNDRTFADVEVNAPTLSPTPATGAGRCDIHKLTLTAGNARLQLEDLHIGGDVKLQGGSLTFNPVAPTNVVLDGVTPQTLSRTSGSWSFNNSAHLQFSNPSGITLASGFLPLGHATLDAGCTLTVGSGPLASLQNNNTFDVYGTLLLSAGSTPPTGQPFTYHAGSRLVFANTAHFAAASPAWWPSFPSASPTDVVMQGSGGVELQDSGSRIVDGTLQLNVGVLDVGEGVIELGSAGAVSGGGTASHVKGTLRKPVAVAAGSSSYAFEIGDGSVYAPVTVQFPSVGGAGTLSARTRAGDHPGILFSGLDPARTANRYWTLGNIGITHAPATVQFTYSASDLDPAAEPLSFGAAREQGSAWEAVGTTSAQPTGVTAQGLIAFGSFQLGEALPPCNPSASFTRTDFATGVGPNALAVADLNADGRPDVATANYNSNSVSVLLGSGSGTLALANTYAAGANPVSMAIGDVNADSRPDLVVANWGGTDVSEFLGTGGGAFAAAAPVSPTLSLARPISALLGHLNGDASPDLFVVSWSGGLCAALPGSPSGVFGATTTVPAELSAYDAALGDLNGDGKLDAVIANRAYGPAGTTLSVRLGDGAGGFTSASDVTVGTQPAAVALGDVNRDGLLDAVCVNEVSNTISILAGNGLGGFSSRLDVATGNAPFDVAIGDVNGDGREDIVVVDSGDGTVSVFPSNCAGGFLPRISFAVGAAPRHVAIADLDQDGFDDLVVTNATSNTVSVLRSDLGSPLVTSTVYRGRAHQRLGDALLLKQGSTRLRVTNLGSSGQDGVSIAPTSPTTPATIDFGGDAPSIGGVFDDWGWISVTLDGAAAGAFGSLGGMRLDSKPTGIELRTDFAPVGATHQRVELFAGNTLVHSCDVPNNALVTRPHLPSAQQAGAHDAAPASSQAAGDGIGGVEVGLKKKPGPQKMVSTTQFTTLRPTTLNGTTVNADRVVVSAYAPRQPLVFAATELRASAPTPTHPLNTISIATEPDMVSDTTWQVAGLEVRAAGNAQLVLTADEITVAGIGGMGQDGPDCILSNADGAEFAFAPGQGFQTARDAGAELTHALYGVVGCADDVLVGTLTERAFGDSITVRSDFSPIGATQVTIELLNEGTVVHSGVYAAAQSVALVAPPAGPGQSSQAASINTSRSNLKDRSDSTPAKKPKQSIAWSPDPGSYRLRLGGSDFVGNEVRFTALGGPPVSKLTRASIRQKNPGVPALDTLRLARPALALGATDFTVRAHGGRMMMAPDSGRVVTHPGIIWLEDMWEVAAPAPSPQISVRTAGPTVTTSAPTAKLEVSASGLTAANVAASTPRVSIARSGGVFSISPSLASLALQPVKQAVPASANGNWRLQVMSGGIGLADYYLPWPEATVGQFPDRIGAEAIGSGFEITWATSLPISVTGGPTVIGDRVKLTPLAPPAALAQLTALVFEPTDMGFVELSDPGASTTTDVPADALRDPIALAVLRNPVRGDGPVHFAVQLPSAQRVRLELFDLLGRRVATLHDGLLPAGLSQLTWNASARRMGSGVMLARLVTPNGTRTEKFVMIR